MIDISVIIPTLNRLEILKKSLVAWERLNKFTKYKYELIYVDGCSEDDTVKFLKKNKSLPIKVIEKIPNGVSSQRNVGICASSGKRILFTGDDIFPEKNLLDLHIEIGKKIGLQNALLGNIEWHSDLKNNYLNKHITEIGCEQFDFTHLKPNSFTNFQHFYTSNVSLDRATLYQENIFFNEEFTLPNYEDIELAYRLEKKGLRIFYSPRIQSYHYHPYNLDGFCRRQYIAGKMSIVFKTLHPDADYLLGIEKLSNLYSFFQKNRKIGINNKFLPSLKSVLTVIKQKEDVLKSQPNNFLYRKNLSDYYFRIFQLMYEKGILESLFDQEKNIELYLIQKYFSFDKSLEISSYLSDCNIDLSQINGQEKKFYLKWQSLNTKNKTEADLRYLFQLENDFLHRIIAFIKKYLSISFIKGIIFNKFFFIKKLATFLLKVKQRYLLNSKKNFRKQIINLFLVLTKIPDQKLLDLFFNTFNPKKIFLMIENEDGFFQILPNRHLQKINPSSGFFWKIATNFLSSHLIAVMNAMISLEFLKIDSIVFSNNFDSQIESDFEIIFSDKKNFSPILGKLIKAPYLKCKRSINIDQNILLKNISGYLSSFPSSATKRIKKDLLCLDADKFLSVKKTKPIIFVFPTYLAVGGVERNTLAIIKELKDKFDFVIINFEKITLNSGSLHHEFVNHVAGIYDLAEAIPEDIFLNVLSFLKASYKPDLIWITNGCNWLTTNFDDFKKVFDRTPIVDQRAYDTQVGWINDYFKEDLNDIDSFIAINKRIFRVFEHKFKISQKKIKLIYPCLDSSKIISVRKKQSLDDILLKYSLPKNKSFFVFLGRLVDQKNPMCFLQLANFFKDNSKIHWIMIGNGPLNNQIDSFIRQNKLENVSRFKFISNPVEILSISAALLVLSKYEGLPVSLLESLAVGLPFFSLDVGGISDLEAKYKSGFITSTGNIKDIASDFKIFMKNYSNYRNQARYYQNEILKKFQAENIASQYLDCFNNSIKSYEKFKK